MDAFLRFTRPLLDRAARIGADPGDSDEARLRKALLVVWGGKKSQAIGAMRDAAVAGEPRAMLNLALLLDQAKQNPEEAMDWAKRAVAQLPYSAPAHRDLGVVALHQKQPGLALVHLEVDVTGEREQGLGDAGGGHQSLSSSPSMGAVRRVRRGCPVRVFSSSSISWPWSVSSATSRSSSGSGSLSPGSWPAGGGLTVTAAAEGSCAVCARSHAGAAGSERAAIDSLDRGAPTCSGPPPSCVGPGASRRGPPPPRLAPVLLATGMRVAVN